VYAVAYALPLETIQNLLQTTCPKLHFVPLVAARVRPAATVKLSRRLEIETDILIAKEGYHPDIYIERAAGHLARTALAQRGGVVIIGKPKSGKTRLAWQLLQEHPEAIVVIPKQAQPPEPFGAAGFGGKEVVLFFDDLHSRASSIDPLAWRRRFEDATGQPCLLLCTSRDGADWQRVKGQPHLAYLWESVLRPDTWVFTSKCDAQGEDLPEAEARQLGDALRLSAQEFKRRFDGTPGSLTLDLSAMRERYARLRDEQRGNMALGRLLDSAKLLHAAYQPRLHLAVLRAVAEQIRGDGHMSNEAWDTLKRRTQEEGFGYFAREDFKTYVPYLEECVDYTPDTHELEALLPILVEARDYDGLISLGDAFLFGPQALLPNAERAYREATGGDSAFAYYMLSFVLCNQPGRETEAEQACQAAIERGYTAAYIVLGRIHARQPGHECEAEQTYRQAITLADTANTISSAYVNLAVLLECQPGREQDAEQAYREAMKASDEVPRFYLGKFLARRPGREAEAEELLQDAIAKHADREVYDSFVKEACFYLGYLLANQPGREAEAERMLQDALSRKVRLYHADFHETRAQLEEMAYSRLGSLLANQPGQAAAAEQVYTEGIKAGYKKLYIDLGRLLSTQPGRREEAILAFLKAAQAGIPMPSSHVRIRPPAS
jgi:tetratricopeptide (TPR) repeat protein